MSGEKKINTSSSRLVLLPPKQTRPDEPEIQKDEKETISSLKQKYKDPVLFEIYESERILHSTLANRILVSASGMNAIIKKLNEAKTPPIQIEKQGKFTFYSLNEAGKKYVREELIPSTAANDEDEKRVRNIFDLLSAFKDQNQKNWMDVLSGLLNGGDMEEFEEGQGFIKELGVYYLHSGGEAENLLNLAVTDKELQKKILEYIQKNESRNFEDAGEILNYWLQEDGMEVYRLIDSFFASIVGEEKMPDAGAFELTDIKEYMAVVLNKIQTGLLRALVRKTPKWKTAELWINDGIDMNLAIYLAEKYFIYCLQYEQTIEKRECCV